MDAARGTAGADWSGGGYDFARRRNGREGEEECGRLARGCGDEICPLTFTDDWRFHRGDLDGAEGSAFDDALWRVLDVPQVIPFRSGFVPWCTGTHPDPYNARFLKHSR